MDRILYFYAGVSIWVAMSDGLEIIEKVSIIKRLEEKFPYENDIIFELEELIEKLNNKY